ncbi:hypothetical protein PJN20_29770, partial [Mycobacterium kansasii]
PPCVPRGPPPRSTRRATRFPYPTLFRSADGGAGGILIGNGGAGGNAGRLGPSEEHTSELK